MAVFTTEIPVDWAEFIEPEPLPDELVQPFLAAFDATGANAKGACRKLGVARSAVSARLAIDERFRDEWFCIRRRYSALAIAGDELFAAFDQMDDLVGSERALDHVINVAFDPTEPLPNHVEVFLGEISQEDLDAARERLASAALEWATELIRATGRLEAEVKGRLNTKLAQRRRENARRAARRVVRGEVA